MQMFKVERSELEGRFNPYYHQPKFKEISRGLAYSQYEIKAIGDITTKISGGATPTAKSDAYTTENDGIPFLRIQNITEEGIDLTDVEYITKETHNKLLKISKLFPNDILFTITGRIGTTTVVPDNFGAGNINQHIVRMSLREGINPYYVATFLNSVYGKVQEERKVTGTTRIALDYPAIKSIKIPIPPCPVQDKIAQIRRDAYKQKKEGFREAEDLLAGINDYVLDRLGIKIPEVEEKKTFVATLKDLKEGKRHDPFYCLPRFKELIKELEGRDDILPLKEITSTIMSGQRPKGGVRNIENGVPSLGGEHVNADGTIKTKGLKYIPFDFHKKYSKTSIKPLDILVVKDGATTGKVGIVPLSFPYNECNINEHVFLIRVKDNIESYYVFAFLQSAAGRIQIQRKITGAAQTGITKDVVNSLLIPIPLIEIQKEIAGEVRRRRERAKELQEEAEDVVKLAKEKVERMILGEEK